MRRLILTLLLAAVASTAQARDFDQEYVLEDYPSSAPACYDVARDLGERLVQTYGVTLVDTQCLPSSSGQGVDLRIVYRSEPELFLVSTYDPLSFGSQGYYASEAACRGALSEEARHFAAATGLEPFLALCQLDPIPYGALWNARVDGFGNAERTPKFGQIPVFGAPLGFTPGSFAAWIQGELVSAGFDMRQVVLDGSPGVSNLRFSYYATESEQFDVPTFASVDSAQACEAERALLDAAFPNARPVIASFCMRMTTGGVEAQGLVTDRFAFRAQNTVETFTSYAACTVSRDALIARYRASGMAIAAGFCTRRYVQGVPTREFTVSLLGPVDVHGGRE
jgi:hypothetical protein